MKFRQFSRTNSLFSKTVKNQLQKRIIIQTLQAQLEITNNYLLVVQRSSTIPSKLTTAICTVHCIGVSRISERAEAKSGESGRGALHPKS